LSLQIAESKGIIHIIWPRISHYLLKKNTMLKHQRPKTIKASQQALMAIFLTYFCYSAHVISLPTLPLFDIAWISCIGLIMIKPSPCPHYYYHAQLTFIAARIQANISIQQALLESYPLSRDPLLFLEKITQGLSAGQALSTIISSLYFIPESHRNEFAKSLHQGTLHLDIEQLYQQSQNSYLNRLESRNKLLQTSLVIYTITTLIGIIFYGYLPLMKEMMNPHL